MTSVKARKRITAFGAAALIASLAGIAFAYAHSGVWGPPQEIDEINGNSSELNTAFLDGCPIQSPDGLSLYMASNRPRYVGDLSERCGVRAGCRPVSPAPRSRWAPASTDEAHHDSTQSSVRRRFLAVVDDDSARYSAFFQLGHVNGIWLADQLTRIQIRLRAS
jgi:hypothetical protein